MQLLAGGWEGHFKRLLKQTERDLLIISPFITARATVVLRPFLEQRKLICRVITRRNLQDFYSRVSDIDTLGQLVNAGVQIKSLKGLHAKVYVFDGGRAVVTSANLTGGGLTNEHEWGMLLSQEECPEVFQKADALWGRLVTLITAGDIASIKDRIEAFQRDHPHVVLDPEELLPDEGERDVQDPPNGEVTIGLRSAASAAAVLDAWALAGTVSRVSRAADYLRMGEELRQSASRSISMRSFLWLVGWCNTGGSYKNASPRYLRPLAMTMFGYVPSQQLQLAGTVVNLKEYRYKQAVDETLHRAIAASHVNRLAD